MIFTSLHIRDGVGEGGLCFLIWPDKYYQFLFHVCFYKVERQLSGLSSVIKRALPSHAAPQVPHGQLCLGNCILLGLV